MSQYEDVLHRAATSKGVTVADQAERSTSDSERWDFRWSIDAVHNKKAHILERIQASWDDPLVSRGDKITIVSSKTTSKQQPTMSTLVIYYHNKLCVV